MVTCELGIQRLHRILKSVVRDARLAELLAIDGYYRTAEELDAALRNGPAQAWLEGDIMRITPLN